MKNKIALIAPFLTHYRINFYKKLEKGLNGNIVFFFQNKTDNDGRPGIETESENKYQYYSNFRISLGPIKLTFSRNLISKVRKEKYRILIIEGATSNLTSWYFIIFKKILGIKIIAWACGWQQESYSRILRKIKVPLEKIFFNHVDQIICYSTTAMIYFQAIGITKTITVAFNGIDTEIYYSSSDEIIENAKNIKAEINYKIFLYVGGLFSDKKVDLLIDSFIELNKLNSKTNLWIIGDGPLMNELGEKVSNHKDNNIKLLGRIVEGVEVYFAAADFFVLPGVGGLALNQAMLWHTPCIVSDADGTENDLVLDKITGFRFIRNDPKSLLNAMKCALCLTENEYKDMAMKAQKIILERSNTDQMFISFAKVIESIS